jgi:ABC-type Fe3+-hydroxamate transport system substrate-binding protein
MVAALDVERLVAVDSASNYPDQVTKLPRLAAYPEPSLETLLALRPDLVMTWSHSQQARLASRLERYGIRVIVIAPERLEDVAGEIRKLGHVLGRSKQANELAEHFLQRLAALRQHYSGREPVRVFLQVSSRPLLSVSDRSFLGQAIRVCNGRNIFSEQKTAVSPVSLEAVLAAKPEVIFSTTTSASLQPWSRYAMLPAVARQQLYVLDDDKLLRPGPRLVEGLEMLCRRIDQARAAKMP